MVQDFQKSDIGAQAAWKGFSSQTLYIAYRLISDNQGYEYYPEDVEDLVIKNNGSVIEAVQVKNISAVLTLSSLAASKTSKSGDGFFKRMCGLHANYDSFQSIRVVYFGALGTELEDVENNNADTKKRLSKRLVDNHDLSLEDATWLIDSLKFEKVNLSELDTNICSQIGEYVPVMSAPNLAKDLLIQYVSKLSNCKGFTTLEMWKDEMHNIGISIAALDGFYKEYNKSLVCLNELQMNCNLKQLRDEFAQGVSAHPAHIRCGLDFRRTRWCERIQKVLEEKGTVVIKGVSGQGKSTLCYRYLIDHYPEGCVFCVRAISSEEQAQNLVLALAGMGKHNNNLAIYIDVQPGEILWAFLLQELQTRGLSIPVLISIRDEDYNVTPINGVSLKYDIVELTLSEEEAKQIYDELTGVQPHSAHRSFEEAWQSFGEGGPLIEFVYLLTNNQTLEQRLQAQIDVLLREKISDAWLELLQLVCYAGRLGCGIDLCEVKKVIACTDIQAAINRLKDEYLIRIVDDNKLEALHPVRAQIVSNTLRDKICIKENDIIFKLLPCIASRNIRVILLDYFSCCNYTTKDVEKISEVKFVDWIGYANVIRTMLWLDVKHYVESNMNYIQSFIEKQGKAWFCFLPIDLSGIERPNELIVEGMKEFPNLNLVELQKVIDEVKNSLSSLSIDYKATNYFVKHSVFPNMLPNYDEEKISFGYALFWMAKCGRQVMLPFDSTDVVSCICTGELQACADAVRGLFEHSDLFESYQRAVEIIVNRLISEMSVISFAITDEEVFCKFVPPLFTDKAVPENIKNLNQYWRIKMLDILKQLYPDIEYIDIELIGVDLLSDLGIPVLDNKLHIHKSHRPNSWISEVNGWTKTRIDYSLRPSTWNQYVAEVDKMRMDVYDLILETIKLIDDVYKKGYYTKDRGNRVDERIKVFSAHTFSENLLPHFAVDPYCLYSEGNAKSPIAEFYPMRQLLSVGKYERFRKLLSSVYTSLENFYNQFVEVLQVRIKKQDINTIKNIKIAMYNLYSAAKDIVSFQKEYELLFAKYSSVDEKFDQNELEATLTLVNVWRHVLDDKPRGFAIAYDAKLKYRRGTNYYSDTFVKVVNDVNGTLVDGQKYTYIIVKYDLTEENTIEKEYTNIVLKIRNIFNKAINPSSDRWYVETQSKKLAYVPAIDGVCFPVAYSLPFYKLFDTEEDRIANPMLPCEIDSVLNEQIVCGNIQATWVEAIRKINEIKIYLVQYHQVLQVPMDERCVDTRMLFYENLIEQVKALWEEFEFCRELVNALMEESNGQYMEMLNLVKLFFNCYEEIEDSIKNHIDPNEIIEIMQTVSGMMVILYPYVVRYSSQNENVSNIKVDVSNEQLEIRCKG